MYFTATATLLLCGYALASPCDPIARNESLACRCNATYCDDVDIPADLDPGLLYLFVSSRDGDRFATRTVPFGPEDSAGETTVRVEKSFGREILGFGSGLTDAAVSAVMSLSPETRENLLDGYFSDRGIGYSFVRVPIAASDFSPRRYTYADGGDSGMSLQPEDHSKIQLLREIVERNPERMKLLSAAWYAPKWMVTEDDLFGVVIAPEHYRDWAVYHKKFLDMYGESDVRFWGMSTGNEIHSGNRLSWSMSGHREWINEHLGPILRDAGHHLKLLLLDDDSPYIFNWQNLLRNATTNNFIHGVATHWYLDGDRLAAPYRAFAESFPDKFVLGTDAAFCGEDVRNSWEMAEAYAFDIIQKLGLGVRGWMDRNLAADESGGPNREGKSCFAAVTINPTDDEFYKEPMFYAVAHFSKFLPPGSQSAAAEFEPPAKRLHAIAAHVERAPWKTAVVLLNRKWKETTVRICIEERCAVVEAPPRSILTAIAAR